MEPNLHFAAMYGLRDFVYLTKGLFILEINWEIGRGKVRGTQQPLAAANLFISASEVSVASERASHSMVAFPAPTNTRNPKTFGPPGHTAGLHIRDYGPAGLSYK